MATSVILASLEWTHTEHHRLLEVEYGTSETFWCLNLGSDTLLSAAQIMGAELNGSTGNIYGQDLDVGNSVASGKRRGRPPRAPAFGSGIFDSETLSSVVFPVECRFEGAEFHICEIPPSNLSRFPAPEGTCLATALDVDAKVSLVSIGKPFEVLSLAQDLERELSRTSVSPCCLCVDHREPLIF